MASCSLSLTPWLDSVMTHPRCLVVIQLSLLMRLCSCRSFSSSEELAGQNRSL